MTQLRLESDRPAGVGFTPEQANAIERRAGSLLLDAGAGSGKTTVLVERFARSVVDDQLDVGQILAITFTEKAATELRERIRRRLRELGDEESARAAEAAWISTIHGFCARVVRADALAAGLDPEFAVLDPGDAAQLQGQAFDEALASVAAGEAGVELVSTYGPGRLRSAITSTYAELRSRGLLTPGLPACAPAAGSAGAALDAVRTMAAEALRELGAVQDPGKRVAAAISMLESVQSVLEAGLPWPGEFDSLKLGDGAKALKTDACERYRKAVEVLRVVSGEEYSAATRDGLDVLLRGYGERYDELKRRRSALDFEDLELYARELLGVESIGARYRERFQRVMVDEMQDTNRVQLELIDLVAPDNLFMVGDAQQSIYAFRHADVELFERRGRELESRGARASLQTNFRSRPELLDVLNSAFSRELGSSFRPLVPGRADPPASDPRVELMVVDRLGDYEDEGSVAAWRQAEANVLAGRVSRLLDEGLAQARDVVVLTRATTDLGAYEQALATAGVPTYVVGGRGYWSHPQVVEITSYLRSLANPLDEESWYATLLSPLCGLSLDGLVLLAAGAREELSVVDRDVLDDFERWFAVERSAAARTGAELLIERALRRRDYEQRIAARPDAPRRLANIRKLMRLAREWEAGHGSDLRGFVALLGARADGDGAREGEAPVESEGLDAVRLMTIHRSKGLEFPVVCVADLGRLSTMRGAPIIRVGRDGHRLGLRIGRPGTAGLVESLAYGDLKAEQTAAEAAEERRLFYVAMTRAQERLILSGAGHLTDWEAKNRNAPIGWIASGLVPNLSSRIPEGRFTTDGGVQVTLIDDDSEYVSGHSGRKRTQSHTGKEPGRLSADASGATAAASALSSTAVSAPATLSYTALAAYERCGYRFYVEHQLRLPSAPLSAAVAPAPAAPATPATPATPAVPTTPASAPGALTGAALGTAVHEALRDLDFRRLGARRPRSDLRPELAAMLDAFTGSSTARRLADAERLRREQPFAFLLGGELLMTGVFDAVARERTTSGSPERLLVVDYKTDRLDADPQQLTEEHYGTQRTIYALAALRTGAEEVEVVHLFLEAPARPVSVRHVRTDLPSLENVLSAKVAGLRAGDYHVTAAPGWSTCAGCPAAGGLCSHPLEDVTRR